MKMDWSRLTKQERAEYMAIQTAPRLGYPGLCGACYSRWKALKDKAAV